MQVKNLPDLVRVATRSRVEFLFFCTYPMSAEEAKACVLAIGELKDFVPELVIRAIDAIAALDPYTEFGIAQDYYLVIYIHSSSVPVEELARLLNKTGAEGVQTNETVPTLHFSQPTLVRAVWD